MVISLTCLVEYNILHNKYFTCLSRSGGTGANHLAAYYQHSRMRVLQKLTRRYSPPEVLAHHATNDDLWGPTSKDLQELTALSYTPKNCGKILGVIEHRFRQSDRHWRQKSKGLTVLRHLVLNGSMLCYDWTRSHSNYLRSLRKFNYCDSKNIDQGKPVREKAKALLTLVNDPDNLEEERQKFARQKLEVRTTTGRSSTSSRHTLDLVRESLDEGPLDDQADIPISPLQSPGFVGRASLALERIQEEY